MNRLKSIFISSAISAWTYFSFLFLQNLITNGSGFYSLGLFFISILPLGFFVLLLLFKPFARTTKSLPIITLLIIMGGVICLFAAYNSLLPLHFQYISIISVLMWFIYIKWYSVMPSSKTEIKIDHKNETSLGMEVFGYTSETVLPTVIITNEQGKIL
ncbi:hypothetical protein MNBD_BACTEROID06-685 [hydrothermal vent metagenome]|uniref:Uncharacterized protein n=1 Tax=hydrothermal vent metagenome TaxID=652676 RepID=A0A3B0UGR0_9ZZZZ